MMLIQLILIVVLAALAASEEYARELKKPNANDEELVFSNDGYPDPGDIPVLNRKVFRGTRVVAMEHPYIASIRRNYSHYLTGTILSRNVVVTVAHPLFQYGVSRSVEVCKTSGRSYCQSYQATLHNAGGEILATLLQKNILRNKNCGWSVIKRKRIEFQKHKGESYSDRGSSLLTVLLLVIHQRFNPYTLEHDLALLRLFEDINYKLSVKPISLMMEQHLDGRTGFVTGWGRCDWAPSHLCLPRSSAYYPHEVQDPMLRSITLTLKGNETFYDQYEKQGVPIRAGMLCAGAARAEDLTAACLAVPGAPLAVRGRLLAVQSWGFGCGYATDLPLVYTDLRKHHQWLIRNLKVMGDIHQFDLVQLFEATKSFILKEVMLITRKRPPPQHTHGDLRLQPLHLDQQLAGLVGKVYDLRDFLGQELHQEKKEMYSKLRMKMRDIELSSKKIQLENITSEVGNDGDSSEVSGSSTTDDPGSEYYQELALSAFS